MQGSIPPIGRNKDRRAGSSEAQDDPPDQGQSLVAQFSNRLLPDLVARWQDRLIASWQIEKLRCHVLPIPWRLSA